MSLIQGTGGGLGGAGAPGGALGSFYSHTLDQSLKFNDDDSPSLLKTYSTAQTNTKKITVSVWVKRANISNNRSTIILGRSGGAGRIAFESNDTLLANAFDTGYNGFTSSAVFRDVNAWYHIVYQGNSDTSTLADINKVYVNGVQQTNANSSSLTPQNSATNIIRNGIPTYIGKDPDSSAYHFDGYLAEMHVIDGSVVAPTEFAETKDGIWIPKEYSGGHGNNGFHLTFKDDVVSEGFNAVTYSGISGTQSISGLGFEPDLVWVKKRNNSANHVLQDSVRGSFRYLVPGAASTGAQSAENTTSGYDWFRSFDADGFTVSSTTTGGSATSEWNASGDTYVGWCWEAGGTPTADNSAGAGATPTAGSVKIDGSNLGSALGGSIAATRLSANTSKGFSIVTYTGTGSAGTVAHGLGAAPKWIIAKRRNATDDWYVYHTSLGESAYLTLNSTGTGETSVSYPWNGTAPTSSVFSVNSAASPSSSGTMVAYCWADISGYSKFDSYTGDGTTDGSKTITTGFRPSFVMMKNASASGTNWLMFDSTRDAQPTIELELNANNNNAEGDNGRDVTFTSTGFTVAGNNNINGDGNTHIYMAFADTREAAFFKDVTTNGNHWTPVNLDYRDSVPDVPTNNFATLNPLIPTSSTTAEGNLKANLVPTNTSISSTFAVNSGKWYAEFMPTTIAGYALIGISSPSDTTWQGNSIVLQSHTGNLLDYGDWVASNSSLSTTYTVNDVIGVALDLDGSTIEYFKNGSSIGSADIALGTTNTDVSFILAMSSASATGYTYANFGQDSSFAGNHATANANADGNGHGSFAYAPPSGFLALCSQNLPDVDIIDGSEYFNTVLYTGNATDATAISGVGFSPDWTWIKVRNNTNNHRLFDTVRGAGKDLISNSTSAESTTTTRLQSFDSDGFTVGTNAEVNSNGHNIVAWNWKAGGAAPAQTYVVKVVSDSGNKYRFDDFGTSAVTLNLQEGGTYTFDQSDSSNSGHPLRFSTTSDGTHGSGSEYTTNVTTTGTPGSAGAKTVITVAASAATLYYYCSSHSGMGGQANTNATFGSTNLDGSVLSTVSANTDAGFSIVSYTGTGSNLTVGHGLSSAPEMFICKNLAAGHNWYVYHKEVGYTGDIFLDLTNAGRTLDIYQQQAPTDSLISLKGQARVNESSGNHVMYAFHSVEGYSKVGSYVGNGNANGTFVYTGFRPAFFMVKASGLTENWYMYDAVRNTYNVVDLELNPNASQAEQTFTTLDFVSNGFKVKTNNSAFNTSGQTYIYLAFAAAPFKFSNAR